MLSIVIPTLNEEKYFPLLLESIKKQAFSEYEIIIADAGSSDQTLKIAANFGCRIVPGGLPPKAKNSGASCAQGEIVFFIDADVVLPVLFLKNAVVEFNKRQLGVGSFFLKSENKTRSLAYSILYNLPSLVCESFLPQAMSIFMAKKKIHQKIGGFDESVKLGEELEYIRRAKKFGKFGVLKRDLVFVSSRRCQKDGWFATWLKYFLCQIHMLLAGPVRSSIFNYRFGHYGTICKKERKN
jgi:glycosyltransferase involved in cell wall biosynthesis